MQLDLILLGQHQLKSDIHGSRSYAARRGKPPNPLFQTTIENCSVGAVPIDEINGPVVLPSKCEIPHQRSGRKLAQRMHFQAISLWLRV